MAFLLLTPAYGRDYKSKQSVLEDWDSDKDFLCHEFGQRARYVNKSQEKALLAGGYDKIQFRYGSLKKTFIHPIELD